MKFPIVHYVVFAFQKVIRENDCGTEKLPEGWNSDCEHYSLRYTLGCDVYILNCVIIDKSTALFNLYNVSKTTVSNVSFELREVISYCAESPKRRLVELVPNIDVQILRIRGELIMPVAGCQNCTTETACKDPDPKPFPRIPGEFHCVPNLASGTWPPNLAFEMPNRGLLLPPTTCCQNQCADSEQNNCRSNTTGYVLTVTGFGLCNSTKQEILMLYCRMGNCGMMKPQQCEVNPNDC